MLLPFARPPRADDAVLPEGLEDLLAGAGELPPTVSRARLLRRDKIQRAADEAVENWQELQELQEGTEEEARESVLRALPPPPSLGVERGRLSALPPPRQEEFFTAGILPTVRRLLVWLYGCTAFALGVLIDRLLGRDSEQRRAQRLRRTFEAMGTTFIKFGQQLSMRLDLLPYAYTRELESMLDEVAPMPEEEAIRAIERATGRPLQETFMAFDRHPIGSASVACVYRGVLITGEDVAVKVRRPRIGERLAADMRAMSWLLKIAELFVLSPGFTANFVFELRTMLMEELDFNREARFGELFRRRMRKTRQLRFATAPRVFYEHSAVDVLVAEFVAGTWMSEILTAIETCDQEALSKLEEMNIDPVILARRLQLIGRYNNFENIFFHADLHPKNIVVKPGNKIVLIDFGSCGSFDRKELNSWRRWFEAQSVDDIGGMVQAALAIVEPLPPIDKATFAQRLQMIFWNDLYAIKSKHSHWSERISARLWIGFLKLSREFRMPMRLNTLRMIRASMLVDTISARLDNDQDPYKEYRYYERGAGRRAKKRFLKRIDRLLGPGKFIRLEQSVESGLKLFHRVQQVLDSLSFIGIIPKIGKAAEAVITIIKTAVALGIFATTWALVIFVHQYFQQGFEVVEAPDKLFHILVHVFQNRWFQLIFLIHILVAVRRIFPRLKDPEYERPR